MHHETSATLRAPTLPEDDYSCRNHRRTNDHYVNRSSNPMAHRSSNRSSNPSSNPRTGGATDGTNFQ